MRQRTMRPLVTAAALALISAAGLLAGLGGAVTLAQPQPTEPPPTANPPASACIAATTKTAAPSVLQLGETVAVTLTLRATCPTVAAQPWHVVLLLDGSGSMAGAPSMEMKQAAKTFVDRLGLHTNPSIRVGVVEIASTSRLLCALTDTAGMVKACISRIGAVGGSDIGGAMDVGADELSRGRSGVPGPINEVMLVVSDGPNNAGCEPMLASARRVKGMGVLVATSCIGGACDTSCMRQAASSARFFYPVENAEGLTAAFDAVQAMILSSRVTVRELVVRDRLPANMRYVDGSSVPPAVITPVEHELEWRSNFVPADGITLTFRVRPLEPGTHTTNEHATAAFLDSTGALGMVAFPVPQVTVLGFGPTPTPTPPAPTGVAHLTLSASRLAPGERARATYSLDFDPPSLPGQTHAVLVADGSGSMTGDPSLSLKSALRELVDDLDATGSGVWKAAIVEFNSAARTLCTLTNQVGMLNACISRLAANGGTRIDLGITEGLKALYDGRPAPGQEDMVIISDGANNAGCGPVQSVANIAKGDGVMMHTVCIAGGCDKACMQSVASSPGNYHEAPLATELGAAFGAVAAELTGDRRVDAVRLTLTLPSSVRLVPGSASIPPSSASDHTAEWLVPAVAVDGLDLTFDVEGLTGAGGTVRMDADVTLRRFPPITVSSTFELEGPGEAPTPVASATPVGPSATPAATRSTPVATATFKVPTATPPRIYLPFAVAEVCPVNALDVVLVLDTSLSMGEQTVGGGTKLAAAVEAAGALAAALRASDRAAVVGFDASARLLAPLDAAGGRFRDALAGVALGDGTAIDAGLRLARETLEQDRRADAGPVILLLTDGRSHQSTAAAAIAEADRAKASGISLYAVGLGGEVDARTLEEIASTPSHYRAAAGRDEVVRTFRSIAQAEQCPGVFAER